MNAERVLETFLELVRTDSPSHHEGAVARYCATRLEALGFTVSYDDSAAVTGSETGNLIARLPGNAPARLALSAHMDCVSPCQGVKPVIADGVIRSDGTTVLGGDDKSGVAAILEALTCIVESGAPRPDLTVILSVCEELSVYGARFLPDDLFPVSTLCLVLDAEGTPGGITIAAPYHCSFHAIFHGTSAHAGVNPEDGCNALQMAAKAVTLMELGRIDDRTTASVGIVSGGSAVNIVPDTCVLDGECRSIDETRVEEVKRAMTDAMHAGAAAYGGTAEVAWELAYKGLSYREDDPDVQLLLDTARACGLTGYTAMSGGGSDANVLSPKGAKPLVLNTGMTDFHSIHESLKVSDLEDCARYVESIVEAVARRG